MNKLIISFFAIMSLIFCYNVSMASEVESEQIDISGLYVTPKFGISYVELDDIHGKDYNYSHGHDTTVAAGLSVGYDFNRKFDVPVRAELEYLYRGSAKTYLQDGTHFKNEAHSIMVNAAYDFKEVPIVTPYITAGCGTTWLGDGSANFAYNFGGGLYYDITENVACDMSVRYIDYDELNKNGYKVDQSGANIMVGLRYTF